MHIESAESWILRQAFIKNQLFCDRSHAIWRGLKLVFCVRYLSKANCLRQAECHMAGAEVDILREAFIKNRKISYAARVLCLATPGPQGLKGEGVGRTRVGF